MGVVIHHYVSLYSFLMGVLWFNVFIILGLLIRKIKYPVLFSATPLLILLIFSILRMFVVVEIPGSVVILSETLYPAVIRFARFELVNIPGLSISVAGVFILVWASVAVYLIHKHLSEYFDRRKFIDILVEDATRDEHAEELLASMIGYDKTFRVFRMNAFSTPCATTHKPYIILPVHDFTDDDLRLVLLHEWKHIQDNDTPKTKVIEVICLAFWWNPFVYILRKNFSFAKELKCDHFAVSNDEEFQRYMDIILTVATLQKQRREYYKSAASSSFLSSSHETLDRLRVLNIKGTSRSLRILVNVCSFAVIVAMFFASYMVIVLPAFWESDDIPVSAEHFTVEYSESGEVFRSEEIFVIDNGDGTFSFYMEGQFVKYVCSTSEMLEFIQVMERD